MIRFRTAHREHHGDRRGQQKNNTPRIILIRPAVTERHENSGTGGQQHEGAHEETERVIDKHA